MRIHALVLGALALSSSLSVLPAVADDSWHHRVMRSDEGVQISIDYQIRQSSQTGCLQCQIPILAAPLWINVKGHDLDEQDQVRVVLINQYYNPYSAGGPIREGEYIQDMVFAEPGRFTAQLQDLAIFSSGFQGAWYFEQEVAVVINGSWLTDSASGSHNFKISLY